MKRTFSLLYIVLSASLAGLSACSTQTTETSAATSAPAAKPAAEASKAEVYECPMQCEGSRSSKPGTCPVCGMDLEKKS